MESARTYTYRVKFAGDVDKEKLDKFKQSLEQFKSKSVSDLNTTPITKNPYGFPGIENVEISIMDIELEYPTTTQQVVELARLSGIDPNMVRVIDKDHDESMTQELEDTLAPTKKAQLETELPKPSKEQKQASKAYSTAFKNLVKNAASKTKITIAGGKPEQAQFQPMDLQQKSVLGNAKQPEIKDVTK